MDTTTALALVFPKEINDFINEIRSKYDNAYNRWMPHINFVFPFIEIEKFDEYEKKINELLNNYEPFELEFKEIGYFDQKKNGFTFHLKPNDDFNLQIIFKLLVSGLNIEDKDFHPHITLAQSSRIEFDDMFKELRKWLGNGIKIKINGLCFLSRSKIDNNIPFSINRTIKFQEKKIMMLKHK